MKPNSDTTETIEYLEIYRQRYETFRHLDKLRWQMLQIGVAAGSIVLAFGRGGDAQPGWWTWFAVGAVLVVSGLAMIRIGRGISSNSIVLNRVGKIIGDENLPIASKNWGSVAFWIALLMTLIGVLSIIYSIFIVGI